MTVELADGAETTVDVYGYRCEEAAVPDTDACPYHHDRRAWGWAV
jgi:hypothetical protein